MSVFTTPLALPGTIIPRGATILFITAAPTDQEAVDSSGEFVAIHETVQGFFELVVKTNAAPADLVKTIGSVKPDIVHFSGHGSGETGLVFQSMNQQAVLLSSQALDSLLAIDAYMQPVKLMLLNACWSVEQANTVARQGPDAIGMKLDVLDVTARAFAREFYEALVRGDTVDVAMQAARAAIIGSAIPEADTPVLVPGSRRRKEGDAKVLLSQSLNSAVRRIKSCFTDDTAVANQVERACKLLLDLLDSFALDDALFPDAYMLQKEANHLESRRRSLSIPDDEYFEESQRIAERTIHLASEVKQRAFNTLVVPGQEWSEIKTPIAAPVIAQPSDIPEAVAPQGSVPASPRTRLSEALQMFEQNRQRDNVVFRGAGLSKHFGNKEGFVLKGVDLELRKGEITGLLGVNGSGKSTLLRIIAGELLGSGRREYPALQCTHTDWVTIRRRIAFVQQRPERWPGTVDDALVRHAAFFGLPGQEGRKRVDFYLHRLGLERFKGHTWTTLSGSYRTRFELARAMLSRPAMLVLDEPLAPLDVPAQMGFLADLADFANDPVTPIPVLLSSQHIYEVEAVADQMLVLQDGKVLRYCATGELGVGRAENWFQITCPMPDAESLRCALTSCKVRNVRDLGAQTYVVTTELDITAAKVLAELLQSNVPVQHFHDGSNSSRRIMDS